MVYRVLVEEIKSTKQAKIELLRIYEEDPDGWYVFLGRDKKGYYNTNIVHRKDLWLLKEEVINPNETIGYALRTTLEKELKLSEAVAFGLRPIQGELEDVETILRVMLEQKPLPASKITSPYVAEGPYILSNRIDSLITPSQSELERKLTDELDRLIEKRYSYLRRIYG